GMDQADYWFRMENSKSYRIEKSEYNDLDIDNNVKMLLNNDQYHLVWIPYKFETRFFDHILDKM
ncbi:29092_t:CDS:1, partial [Racocetra persica]